MQSFIDLRAYPVHSTIALLLKDKTTKQNIVWATGSYEALGPGYEKGSPISKELLFAEDYSNVIQPRILKAVEEQQTRTRNKGEVFTPAWLCCQMNNYLDDEWFGRENIFFSVKDKDWTPSEGRIDFPEDKDWKAYVDSRRLEITCGEAPFIVSRYDVSTGDVLPLQKRVGLLDRKLRVVNENAESEEEWIKWAIRSVQSIYGYEFQGDNLLIARINVLMTFTDYLEDRFARRATAKELNKVANIIAWNFWQMDGLKGTVPHVATEEAPPQLSLFASENEAMKVEVPCRIYDWRKDKSLEYNTLRRKDT